MPFQNTLMILLIELIQSKQFSYQPIQSLPEKRKNKVILYVSCQELKLKYKAIKTKIQSKQIYSHRELIIILIYLMDSKVSIVTEQTGEGFYVAQFKTNQLAIFSYYIESNKEAILIDPIYDVKTYTDFISSRHSTLKFVALTHYHADYLSGHTEFKVPIVMGQNSTLAANKFKVKECKDGQLLHLGQVQIQVIHTPGHTLESSCYLLKDSKNIDSVLFTGDTVFLGQIGRPDLACSQKLTSHDLAGMLYDSIQKLKVLDGSIRFYPGHGSGSACGKSIGAGNFCTLENQKTGNYGFLFTDKHSFVEGVTANISQPPKYFFFDAATNKVGAKSYGQAFSKASHGLSIEQFHAFRKAALKIIDTRFDIGHGLIKGSYWLPRNGAIVNWISNFVAPQEQFVILCDEGKAKDVIDRFFRIGYFRIVGYNHFNVSDLKEDFIKPQIINFATLKTIQGRTHLDVRNQPQYSVTGVAEGAVVIPLPTLQSRIHELKDKKNIIINCQTGVRARVAFSILARHGIQAKVIAEKFIQFKDNGINVINYA